MGTLLSATHEILLCVPLQHNANVNQNTERTRLITRNTAANTRRNDIASSAEDGLSQETTHSLLAERSTEELGTDVMIEPLLGRKSWKSYLVLILTPIVLCPLPIVLKSMESKAAYGILIIIVYWVTEVSPLAITSTLPLFLFPFLGVLNSTETAAAYFQNANVLFIGGLLVFVAFEEWNLHKRIALKALLVLGTKKQNLLFGFMLTTATISMMLSNTATTAMMVQIVQVILAELEKGMRREIRADTDEDEQQETQIGNSTEYTVLQDEVESEICPEVPQDFDHREFVKKAVRHDDAEDFAKALMICVAFSANIGGIATLTGTGTNMIFAGQALKLFPKSGGVSFGSWFGFSFPLVIILLLVGWLYLVILFLGTGSVSLLSFFTRRRDRDSEAIYNIIKHEYDLLGKMSFAEKAVLGHLIILVLLWLTKDPQYMPGWVIAFRKGYVSDGAVAMLIAFSLFQFPSMMKENHVGVSAGKLGWMTTRPLLDIKMVSEKLCWNVIVLLGSGFAIAAACKNSGLSASISEKLIALKGVPDYAIVSIVCVTVTAITEILSNTGTATIILPVLASLAVSTHIHPWYLMIPATISCSFAFMFPVSTPPNAIVYSTGRLKMLDMVKAGVGMDIICLAVLLMFSNLYGSFYFKFKIFPAWAEPPHLASTVSPTNVTWLQG